MPYQIEVDDEVMELLRSKAEAFVDTPNSVLRRLLLKNGGSDPELEVYGERNAVKRSGVIPQVKGGTPKALQQILQVAYLTRNSNRTRVDATHAVARYHGVAFQTVLDKYARQLDLTTDEFDSMVEEQGLSRLRRLLNSKFARHSDVIEEVLRDA